MTLEVHLRDALGNPGYADAIIMLIKNILIDRNALYAIREWASQFGLRLSDGGEIGDDRLGRALERLFEADRATLQTKIVLKVIKAFNIQMDQIHNDTTSITVTGRYDRQEEGAVQLKRGHSKDHRPDLKQLIYSLCVSRDGGVPVHFKSFDGNRTDDTIHWEIWSELKVLLQTPKFKYVGDAKLCVSKTMRKIDSAHGEFVAMVPRTRSEVDDFANALAQGDVRWERILRRQSNRNRKEFDTFDAAIGPYYLEEGFHLYWYRSTQKKKRDFEDRKERINRAWEKLENMDLKRLRGPKTEKAIRTRISVLRKLKVQEWLEVDIKINAQEKLTATTRGKPTSETRYRRTLKSTPRLHIKRNAEAIAKSQLMDGIFPLTTNTKVGALETLKIYKYQPHIEKRHAKLKSTLDVAPVWLKKNTRIEALMFVE
jgi:transposase